MFRIKKYVLVKEQESYSTLNFRWLKELRHDILVVCSVRR